MKQKDYYRTLGVSSNASLEEIKRAFKKLAVRYHPDLHRNDPGAEEKFKEISEAYGVLANREKRRKYDLSQRAHHREPSAYRAYAGAHFHNRTTVAGGTSDIFRDLFFELRRKGFNTEGPSFEQMFFGSKGMFFGQAFFIDPGGFNRAGRHRSSQDSEAGNEESAPCRKRPWDNKKSIFSQIKEKLHTVLFGNNDRPLGDGRPEDLYYNLPITI